MGRRKNTKGNDALERLEKFDKELEEYNSKVNALVSYLNSSTDPEIQKIIEDPVINFAFHRRAMSIEWLTFIKNKKIKSYHIDALRKLHPAEISIILFGKGPETLIMYLSMKHPPKN